MSTPLFPGSTAVSNLRVYEWETEDGLHGGSPHMHTVSTEAYVVTSGTGEVHTLSSGGAAADRLQSGSVLWFSPGTVHRLVNQDALELFVIMQNSGLPEAGDAVLTFPLEILRSPEDYAAAAAIPAEATVDEQRLAAKTRRDLAIEGYRELITAVKKDGPEALAEFQSLAAALVQPKVAAWQQLWGSTVEAETERTRAQLAALALGDWRHLAQGAVVRPEPRPGPRLFGMCGHLQTWASPTTQQGRDRRTDETGQHIKQMGESIVSRTESPSPVPTTVGTGEATL
jgi:mannose-6-phosphate isomerase-like protein (cupin superfamily)